MTSSKLIVLVLALSACTSPNGAGLFDPPADFSEAGAGGETNDAGASSSGGTAGASGGTAGTSGASAGTSGASAGTAGGAGTAPAGGGGGGGVAGNGTSGSATAGARAGGSGGASAGGGGTSGGGGGVTGTGGTLSKCELMAVQANAALAIAQSCSALGDHPYCTGYVKNECGCQVPVDVGDSDQAATYAKQRDAYLAECKPACTVACTEPASQTCLVSGGFVTGMCVARPK